MSEPLLFSLGFVLVLVGVVVAFVAVILLVLSPVRGGGKVRGGGAVIIGPFPIVFGTDTKSVKILLVLSLTLIVVVLIAMFFYRFVFS